MAVKYFLLLLCACKLVYGDALICDIAINGKITNNPHSTAVGVLPAGQQQFTLPIDNLCPSPYIQVGESVTACDNYAAPIVTFDSHTEAAITRIQYQDSGTVQYTVYCDY